MHYTPSKFVCQYILEFCYHFLLVLTSSSFLFFMEDNNMTFGEKIKAERTRRGMDQKEFGRLIGVSARMISVYENNKAFPRTRVDYARIANILDIDVNYLLMEKEDFVADMRREFGFRGAQGVQKILDQINDIYNNGEIDEDDLEILTKGIQDIYWNVRQKNKEKYNSNKNQNKDAADSNTDDEA